MASIKNDNWIRRFEVAEPKKHKMGFTIYKVTSVVFPKSAPEASTSVVVWKRYNDFKKLHKTLQYYQKQCNISEELPQLCKGKYFKRFEDNVIQDRINFALELLNYIGRHQVLFTSDPFLQFFNNGYSISDSTIIDDVAPETCLNGNNLSSCSHSTQRSDVRIGSPGTLWDSRSSNESISATNECSDEDSNITSGTPDSVSPIHSIHSNKYSANNLQEALDVVDAPALLLNKKIEELDESQTLGKCNNSTSVGEVDTSPLGSAMEICLSVRTEDFRSSSDTLLKADLTDEWITPPGTPAERHDYLVEAAYHVGRAQKYEVEGNFEAAFCFYKAATACLLSGVQDDGDKRRRQAVREKTNQYLQRAEKIYALHLAPEGEAEPKKATETELKMYKVLGVIDTVMLVLNTADDNCYVIKVLQKSPCPIDTKKKTIIPFNVPYMVKLIKYFENENSIFLVLEYVNRGKLWDSLDTFSAAKHISDNEYYSFSSCISEYDYLDLCKSDAKVSDSDSKSFVPSNDLHLAIDSLALNESGNENEKSSPVKSGSHEIRKLADLEVENLVENSQKLLNSVNKTLMNSEELTSSLNKELNDIETIFDLKCRLLASEKIGFRSQERCAKKRSKSAVHVTKIDRSYSSEVTAEESIERHSPDEVVCERDFCLQDLSDRARTACSSVDRRSDWSKASMSRIPESVIRGWASELLVALETLHRWGIICRDLHPGNLLLGDDGHILLTFQAHWKGVDSLISESSVSGLFAAPETMSVFPITPAADWWSFGALLHYLFTGKTLSSCYPEGILGHTILTFPDTLSQEACSLLRELLKHEPGERLGGRINGAEEIKCHPFFSFVDWQVIYNNC